MKSFSSLFVRGESTAIFHLLLTEEVIGAMHDFIALYDFLPVTIMYDITNFVAMYILLPRAISSLSTEIDFDQPEKLPLVFHVDAGMMAFDHAKKVAVIHTVL